MGEWQPIETAPKNGTVVDLWLRFLDRPAREADCWFTKGVWRQGVHGRTVRRDLITHWRHLPEPPT